MINLLPDETKREIQAARMNVVLLRYNLLILSALGIMAGLCLLFYMILYNAQSHAVDTKKDNVVRAASFYNVRENADEYRSNLSIARKILNNSVNYTSVIFAITELLPEGVIMDNINLNASDFGEQTTFSAYARTYAKATELKENFQNSKMFSNVYLQNLADNSTSGNAAAAGYPIAVTISAKLNRTTE